MWAFLSFLVGAKFWRSLATSVIESIPSVIALGSVVLTSLWSLGSWLVTSNFKGLKQLWLTPIVLVPLLTTNLVTAYVSYDYGTKIKTEQSIKDLRKKYRFVPRKTTRENDYNFIWKEPVSWITGLF